MRQTWLEWVVVKCLRTTRRCVSRLTGHPLTKDADGYATIAWGLALAVVPLLFVCRSVIRNHFPIEVMLPAAAGLALAAGVVLLGLRKGRRKIVIAERVRQELCVRCGYDLRASPGRCPECGARREDPAA